MRAPAAGARRARSAARRCTPQQLLEGVHPGLAGLPLDQVQALVPVRQQQVVEAQHDPLAVGDRGGGPAELSHPRRCRRPCRRPRRSSTGPSTSGAPSKGASVACRSAPGLHDRDLEQRLDQDEVEAGSGRGLGGGACVGDGHGVNVSRRGLRVTVPAASRSPRPSDGAPAGAGILVRRDSGERCGSGPVVVILEVRPRCDVDPVVVRTGRPEPPPRTGAHPAKCADFAFTVKVNVPEGEEWAVVGATQRVPWTRAPPSRRDVTMGTGPKPCGPRCACARSRTASEPSPTWPRPCGRQPRRPIPSS